MSINVSIEAVKPGLVQETRYASIETTEELKQAIPLLFKGVTLTGGWEITFRTWVDQAVQERFRFSGYHYDNDMFTMWSSDMDYNSKDYTFADEGDALKFLKKFIQEKSKNYVRSV